MRPGVDVGQGIVDNVGNLGALQVIILDLLAVLATSHTLLLQRQDHWTHHGLPFAKLPVFVRILAILAHAETIQEGVCLAARIDDDGNIADWQNACLFGLLADTLNSIPYL